MMENGKLFGVGSLPYFELLESSKSDAEVVDVDRRETSARDDLRVSCVPYVQYSVYTGLH